MPEADRFGLFRALLEARSANEGRADIELGSPSPTVNAEADARHMRRALDLAVRGRGTASPNPMVGAVVVKGGAVVGEGYHRAAGGPHAEIVALERAGEAARGATLYVTLEPCCHHGRTGPCTDAVIGAGIARAVVATEDPNPRVSGRGIAELRLSGIDVTVGVLEGEARRLNEAFFRYVKARRPFVVAKAAMSLDGKIATRTGASRWITGPAARAEVHRLRAESDAVMVGVGTLLADDPRLTARTPTPPPKQPVRIVVDSTARTPPDAALFGSPGRVVIAATRRAPEERVERLRNRGAEVWSLPDRDGRVDLVTFLRRLAQHEVTSLLCEGGATLVAALLEAQLVDRVQFYIAPLLIGGADAPSPVGGGGVSELRLAHRVVDLNVRRIERDIVIEGVIERCSQES